MKKATFSVVLKDGKPWIKWEQYETIYMRIWKAKTSRPYCKYMGITVFIDDYLVDELREIQKHEKVI